MAGIIERMPSPRELKGYFQVNIKDKDGNIVDHYEDNNLIVFSARKHMASLIGNKDKDGITRILLGTKGHNPDTGNILEPRNVGEQGYDETRTKLFSQEDDSFYYKIWWDPYNLKDKDGKPAAWKDNTIQFIATGNPRETVTEDAKIPVTIKVNDNILEYNFEINNFYANGDDGKSVVAYTEATLMCGSQMFSIKTYPAKTKDISSTLEIIWKIIF